MSAFQKIKKAALAMLLGGVLATSSMAPALAIGGGTGADVGGSGNSGVGVIYQPGGSLNIPGGQYYGDLSQAGNNYPQKEYFLDNDSACTNGGSGLLITYPGPGSPGIRSCFKPAPFEVISGDELCVSRSAVEVSMTAPKQVIKDEASTITRWGKNGKTLADCRASQKIWIEIDYQPDEFGHWRSKGFTDLDKVWWRVPVGGSIAQGTISEKRFHKRVATFDTVGTQRCDGWHPGKLIDFKGGMGPCSLDSNTLKTPNGGTPVYKCVVDPKSGRVNGNTGVQQLMRSGAAAKLTWKMPKVTGVTNVKGTGTSFTVQNAPGNLQATSNTKKWFFDLKTKAGKNVLKTQYDPRNTKAKAFTKIETASIPSTVTELQFKPYYTSTRDKPITVTPRFEFEADFKVQTVKVVGIDSVTGEWKTVKSTTTKRDKGYCEGDPAEMEVIKAMSDDIGAFHQEAVAEGNGVWKP